MIKKSIAKVLKLVFMVMMLIAVSACDLGNTPENNGEKKYPENITTQDKKDIDAILKDSETADYDSLLTKLTKISSFLNEYADDEKVSAYKSNLDEIISEIKNGNFTTLDSLISKVEYTKPKSYTKKENANYTNYDEYESLYKLYSQVCDEYKKYYDGEYSEKYDAYKQKYDQLSQNPEKFNKLLNLCVIL